VGAGNVPVWIESSANISKAVADIFFGKTFDNGTLCSSEQAIVCDRAIQSQVIAECKQQGGYFLNKTEQAQLENVMFLPRINPEIVGKSALAIARLAGIALPASTRVLIATLDQVGPDYPLSGEKLSPVLAFYTVDNLDAAINRCREVLQFGGLGHSMAIHTEDEDLVLKVALVQPAHRILVNTVSAVGAVGFTTGFAPALSLGVGTIGGSITTDNITPMHLLNIKRIGFETRPIHDGAGKMIHPAENTQIPAKLSFRLADPVV
jgi:acetaldehyde dehydrogenase (acetylating)